MKQYLHIPNRLPGLNDILAAARITKGRWNKYANMKKQYGLELCLLIKQQELQPIHSMIDIEFHWYEKSKKRDKDNIAAGKKFILDALVDSGILGGDDWRYINSFSDYFHIDSDRVEVIITITEGELEL